MRYIFRHIYEDNNYKIENGLHEEKGHASVALSFEGSAAKYLNSFF